MNDAAKDILSEEDNYSAVANAICHRCEGIRMPMMYNHVEIVSRVRASTSYEFSSVYEDERSKVMLLLQLISLLIRIEDSCIYASKCLITN